MVARFSSKNAYLMRSIFFWNFLSKCLTPYLGGGIFKECHRYLGGTRRKRPEL